MIINKNFGSLDIREFGAIGNGVADDTDAIQNAINVAYLSERSVVIPYTEKGYNIHKPLRVKKGVKLISNLGKINRKFARAISGWAIFLEGDNVIDGIDYDGGSDTIQVDLPGNEFIYYVDFATDGASGPIWIQNCKFSKTCGSYIVGNSDNVFITNNTFGEYLDHAIYFGGRNTGAGVVAENILVSGNIFNAPVSTREAIKARNGIKNYSIISNILNLTNGAFCTLDMGDSSIISTDNQNVIVSDNVGYCPRFVNIAGRDDTALLNSLNITGNNVTCSNEVLFFGNIPSTSQQKGCSIKNGNISGNIFKTARQFSIINGDLINMIDVLNISNNHIVFGDATDVLFGLYGNINLLKFEGNTVKCNRTVFSTSSYFKVTGLYDTPEFFPTIKGTLRIHDNTFIGEVQSIIADNTSNSTNAKSAVVWNLDLSGNTMISNGNKIPINVTGSYVNTITTSCIVRNTSTIGSGTTSKNRFKNTNLIDDQNKTAFSIGLPEQQTLSTNSTKINFTIKEFDNRDEYDGANAKFVVTQDGTYQAVVSVECNGHADGGQASLLLYKNGSEIRRIAMQYFNTDANQTVNGTAIVNLVAGDNVEVYIYTSTTSIKLINNASRSYFQMFKI